MNLYSYVSAFASMEHDLRTTCSHEKYTKNEGCKVDKTKLEITKHNNNLTGI